MRGILRTVEKAVGCNKVLSITRILAVVDDVHRCTDEEEYQPCVTGTVGPHKKFVKPLNIYIF